MRTTVVNQEWSEHSLAWYLWKLCSLWASRCSSVSTFSRSIPRTAVSSLLVEPCTFFRDPRLATHQHRAASDPYPESFSPGGGGLPSVPKPYLFSPQGFPLKSLFLTCFSFKIILANCGKCEMYRTKKGEKSPQSYYP